MIKLHQRLTHGRVYYADDNPYPGDDAARLEAVCDVHEDNKGGGFNLLHFDKVEYLARGQVRAIWTKTIFERVR